MIRSIRPLSRSASSLASQLGLAGALALSGCSGNAADPDHHHHHESEVITTVRLTFTPQGGGEAVVASFRDPDGDGGTSGSAEPIALVSGTTYALGVELLNELEDPPEDITAQIEEEAEEHQIFVLGSAVEGPATATSPDAVLRHAYADVESDYGENAVGSDLPVGLANEIVARAAGSGTLTVMLRHLPELNGQPQKTAGLEAALAAGEPLPGDVDGQVDFMVTVR